MDAHPERQSHPPVLWMLFPNHPYLLESRFDLTPSLKSSGYVSKPIVGRCGKNIAVFDSAAGLLAETAGEFHDQDQIYQQHWPLPVMAGNHVQVCSFSVGGGYAGAYSRVDPSPVIASSSDLNSNRDDPLVRWAPRRLCAAPGAWAARRHVRRGAASLACFPKHRSDPATCDQTQRSAADVVNGRRRGCFGGEHLDVVKDIDHA